MSKIHMRDIRLSVNAGVQYPVCYAGRELLDVDKAGLPITGKLAECTCKNCKRSFKLRYPWARGK